MAVVLVDRADVAAEPGRLPAKLWISAPVEGEHPTVAAATLGGVPEAVIERDDVARLGFERDSPRHVRRVEVVHALLERVGEVLAEVEVVAAGDDAQATVAFGHRI